MSGQEQRRKADLHVSTSTGMGPLGNNPADALRRSLSLPRGSDLSPGEAFAAELEGDSVVLTEVATGTRRAVPVQGIRPLDVTVSDRGDLAVVGDPGDGRGQVVGRLDGDGTFHQVARGHGACSPELSADGSQLTWLTSFEVHQAGPDGPVQLASLENPAGSSQFDAAGRLVVRSDKDPWGTGFPVPHYTVVDAQGAVQRIRDVAAAEAFGAPVRAPLEGVFGKLFEGATPQQAARSVDLFGYRTPSFRGQSPSRQRTVFWVPPGEPGQAFGLYRIHSGQSGPEPALSPGMAEALGSRQVSRAEWQPGERRAAVLFGGFGGRVAVVDFQGAAHLLVGEPAGSDRPQAISWSPDGRWLALEMKEGDHLAVHLYDPEAMRSWPLVPQGEIQGWKEGRLQVRVDGKVQDLVPGPLDLERGRDYLTGGKASPPGRIESDSEGVIIGGVRLPVRKS
jgi:hypothetical protein